jgi:DNA-binding Xre family transcriptional regulator
MRRKMGYRWHLRQVMATRNLFQTSELVGPLAERGIELSREQVYRLVVGTPERLNLHVLAALCDILGCGVEDLLEPFVEQAAVRKTASGAGRDRAGDLKGRAPTRARVLPPR